MELEFYLKNSAGKLVSPTQIKNNIEAIYEWRFNSGKYVMNGTDWQLGCYSTFCL